MHDNPRSFRRGGHIGGVHGVTKSASCLLRAPMQRADAPATSRERESSFAAYATGRANE